MFNTNPATPIDQTANGLRLLGEDFPLFIPTAPEGDGESFKILRQKEIDYD